MIVLRILLGLVGLLGTLFIYRAFRLFYDLDRRPRSVRRRRDDSTRLLIVLGSGGHTAEMVAMLRDLDTERYSHRSYIVSSGDAFSARKAEEFEQQLLIRSGGAHEGSKQKLRGQVDRAGNFDIAVVPRARTVYQSIWTTPWTSLLCLWACLKILRRPKTMPPNVILSEGTRRQRPQLGYPDLIITNGPGTGVIVVLASFLVRFLRLPSSQGEMRTIYVESWARVRRLSLSGKILLRVVDRFLVQWEALVEVTEGRGEYCGVLV